MSSKSSFPLTLLIGFHLPKQTDHLPLRRSLSSGGEDQAEFDEAEAGDRSDRREDRRRPAHAAAGQTQREVQHDARHARHQHPRARRRALHVVFSPHRAPEPKQKLTTPLLYLLLQPRAVVLSLIVLDP